MRILKGITALLLGIVLLTGCGGSNTASSPTFGDYSSIRTGMTNMEVMGCIGTGGRVDSVLEMGDSEIKTIKWGGGTWEIKVKYVDGKVVSKSQSGL